MEASWIDKIEVARRQISEAVRLYFGERDCVAIHTIIASAHQVLFDIGSKRGTVSALKNPATVHDLPFKGYVRNINYPYNFFKHADHDSDGRINVAPLLEFTSDFLMDAIWMLQQIAGELPIEAKVFWAWFVSKHPEGFDNLPEESEIRKMQQLRLADWDFPRILTFIEFAHTVKGITT